MMRDENSNVEQESTSESDVEATTRQVTVFFSDIVQSCALAENFGDQKASDLVNQIISMQRQIVESDSHGRLLRTLGDGIMAVFDTSSAAMTRAIEIQSELKKKRESDCPDLPEVRIGLHLGEIMLEEAGRLELVSRHINRTHRIMEVANGGQIIASRPVVDSGRDFVKGIPRESLSIRYYGEYYLKGVGAVELCEVADLRITTPEAPACLGRDDDNKGVTGRLELAGYKPEGRLGEGAFGVVYKATRLSDGRIVAIKILNPDLVSHADSLMQFKSEARKLSSLDIPGIVNVLEYRLDDSLPFIVMDLIEGQPIDKALRHATPERISNVCKKRRKNVPDGGEKVYHLGVGILGYLGIVQNYRSFR